MEYRDNIKTLKKEFFKIIKQYYKTQGLIFKMITARELSDCDLAFRTSELYAFSDKYINQLYDKDKSSAINELIVRAVSCIYITYHIEDIIVSNIAPSEQYINFVKNLRAINNKLYDLADNSIKLSNEWAEQNNLKTTFSIEEFKRSTRNHEL